MVCNAACSFPTFSGGDRLTPISRPSATSCVDLELRPLPSTGVTRLRRYYEPLRHPRRPDPSRAGDRLRATRPHRLGFPVLRCIFMCRHAVVITPVARWVRSLVGRPIPPVSLFASGYGLPPLDARSALTLVVSRPAQRSLALRPACSLHRLKATHLSRRLRRFRHLHHRSDSSWLERPSCQAGLTPAEDQHLNTAHTKADTAKPPQRLTPRSPPGDDAARNYCTPRACRAVRKPASSQPVRRYTTLPERSSR